MHGEKKRSNVLHSSDIWKSPRPWEVDGALTSVPTTKNKKNKKHQTKTSLQ
jgi:hypothetical protein